MLAKLKALFSSPKAALRIWQVARLLALLILIFSIVQFFMHYREVGKDLMEKGRRVEISVPDGKVQSRETLAALRGEEVETPSEPEKIPEEDADKPQLPPPADKPEVKTGEFEPKPSAVAPAVPSGEGGSVPAAQVPSGAPASTGAVAPKPAENPKMSIIITDVGLSRTTTDIVFTLPAVVSLGFSPYAGNVDAAVKEAVAQGYEVFMGLPLEPSDYPLSDPGPLALLTSMGDKQNEEQLSVVLSLSAEIAGLMAPYDEQFTYSVKDISALLGVLAERQVPLLYAAKPGNHFLPAAAKQLGAETYTYDIVLDDVLTREAIIAKLNNATSRARKEGKVNVIGRPYPLTIEVINLWFASPEARGVRVVPVKVSQQKETKPEEKEAGKENAGEGKKSEPAAGE